MPTVKRETDRQTDTHTHTHTHHTHTEAKRMNATFYYLAQAPL